MFEEELPKATALFNEQAEEFLVADPYVIEGLDEDEIKKYRQERMDKCNNIFNKEFKSKGKIGTGASARRRARDMEGYNTDNVEEKFERNFRVSREMRNEILVYESILSKF